MTMLGLWVPPLWRRTPAPALPAAETVQLTSDNAGAVVEWLAERGADICATTAGPNVHIDLIDLETRFGVPVEPGDWVVHRGRRFAVLKGAATDDDWVRGLG